jgi:HAD superfamily hydrolase (TIGR01509 family)
LKFLLRPRAIFIDLDGTLADSMLVMRAAYDTFLDRYDIVSTNAEFDCLNGPPLAEVVQRLKIAHSIIEGEDELLATYANILDHSYAHVSPCLGAGDLLRRAKDNSCIVAIVTSNSGLRTHRWLQTTRLSPFVDFVVSGDEVQFGKPNPEPYLRACKRASCPSAETIAVEDSPQGARSAVEAGLKTFVVTRELAPETWPREVVAVDSLAELAEGLW